jgi:hypothetical protein
MSGNAFSDLDRAILKRMLDNEAELLRLMRAHSDGVLDRQRRMHFHHPDNMDRNHAFRR